MFNVTTYTHKKLFLIAQYERQLNVHHFVVILDSRQPMHHLVLFYTGS